MPGGRPKRGEERKPTVTETGMVNVGCHLERAVFDRLEAFRADNFNVPRATLIAKAIEQFLDREAPAKGRK
ncbi:MAG: hypothetical protein WCC97_08370 [Candidatus Acidiferrales bacterium]